MERCRQRGSSASEELRAFIDRYLADPVEQPVKKVSAMPLVLKPALIAACTAPLGIAWLALTPTPVSAAPDLRATFERLDADRDGSISLDEFTRRRDDHIMFVERAEAPAAGRPAAGPGAVPFVLPLTADVAPAPRPRSAPREMLVEEHARQDLDGSGGVTFAEFLAHHQALMRAGFDALDADRDGGIDREELGTAAAHLPGPGPRPDFALLDRDGDGRVEWEEFAPR